jgi:hypothetical protein
MLSDGAHPLYATNALRARSRGYNETASIAEKQQLLRQAALEHAEHHRSPDNVQTGDGSVDEPGHDFGDGSDPETEVNAHCFLPSTRFELQY